MKSWLRLLPVLPLALVAMGAVHCSAAEEAEGEDEESALGEGLFKPYETPDPNNPWTKAADLDKYDLGQENVLPDEDKRFADIVTRVRVMQDGTAKARNGGKAHRTFHAKSHACIAGKLTITPPAGVSAAGLFSPDNARVAHPTLVRLSNGVGFKQADRKIDVRGVAFKISGVIGEMLPGAPAGEQDILLTNGPITPAPHAEHFVEFMEVLAKVEVESQGGVLDTFKALLKAAPYVGESRNERVRRNIVVEMLPRALRHGSLYGEQFWSGGAIALGIRSGEAMRAPAVDALKLNAVAGVPRTNADGSVTCTPYSELPNPLDADYFRKDVVQRLKSEGMCFALRAQIQRDAKRQPIEDTSVEWQEKDAPSVTVGMVLVPKTDLTTPEAVAAEAACNDQSFSPWHGLSAHRPLGNIMRVRRVVYAASAKARRP